VTEGLLFASDLLKGEGMFISLKKISTLFLVCVLLLLTGCKTDVSQLCYSDIMGNEDIAFEFRYLRHDIRDPKYGIGTFFICVLKDDGRMNLYYEDAYEETDPYIGPLDSFDYSGKLPFKSCIKRSTKLFEHKVDEIISTMNSCIAETNAETPMRVVLGGNHCEFRIVKDGMAYTYLYSQDEQLPYDLASMITGVFPEIRTVVRKGLI